MKFLLLIILLLFGEPFEQSLLCELNPTFFCSSEIDPILQSPPEDEDSLVHLCGLFMKYFRCMRTFATRCNKFEYYRPSKYIPDARNFVRDLCVEGSYLNQDPFEQSVLCELNPTFFCSSEIDPILQSPPEDEDSLVHLCGLFMEYFRCMRIFATRCDKSEDYRPYKYIPDARNFVAGLCFEGSFLNQDYLRFAKCYKSAMPEIRSCREKFDTNHDSYFSPYEVKDPETIEDICKKHRENVSCISEEIRMKCSGEAKHVFWRIVQLSKYLQVTCPKFDEEN